MPLALIQTAAPATEPVSPNDSEFSMHFRFDARNYEPAPTAPTVALVSPAVAGNVDNGAHRYLATFVTADGETSAGIVSATVTVADKTVNGKVLVSGIPVGGSSITGRKLYRTAAGGSTYLLLTTINDNTTATYTDNIADASLGVGAPTTNTTVDPLFKMLISSARSWAENYCRRAFVTQSWKMVMDRFPRPNFNISSSSANYYGPQYGTLPGPLSTERVDGTTGFEIIVPLPPLQIIDSIKYYDENGVLQTLAPSAYLVDSVSEPARITPAVDTTWPTTQTRANAVEVTFTCGYGAASAVPMGIKHRIILRAATQYEYREELVVPPRGQIHELPYVDGLLDPYRVVTF